MIEGGQSVHPRAHSGSRQHRTTQDAWGQHTERDLPDHNRGTLHERAWEHGAGPAAHIGCRFQILPIDLLEVEPGKGLVV
jgi:hypothetical protein